MNNNHIIIGYGNWGKKITAFLKKKNFFSKIYIKTRNKYFECDKKGKLLEYAFGSGCNTIHLVKCGYDLYGLEAFCTSLLLSSL